MNAFEVFQVVGIAPTDNYQEFRKAYIVKLKRLEAKALQTKGTEDFAEIEDKILQLNEAFNTVTRDNIGLMVEQAINIEAEQKAIPKQLRDTLEFETVSRPEESSIQPLLNSIEIRWEDKELDSVDEIITFNDFMRGTLILFEDNTKMKVPPGFLGVIARVVGSKIQFINIKPKDSVTFVYSGNGNLFLKSIPEDALFDKETGDLRFNMRDVEFNFPLSKFKWSEKANLWEGKNLGVKPFGGKRAGNVLIATTDLKPSRNADVTSEVISYFEGRDK